MLYQDLIDSLIQDGWLKTPRIISAFKKIKRADFLPPESKNLADVNEAFPIGWGQTISQPLVVAFMLELLEPKEGDKVLDIGSGSGWQTAMLCQIVGNQGFVYAVERIAELKEFGQANVQKYDFKNVEFVCADGSKKFKNKAPFDKIIAAASAQEIPQAWKNQLKIGGHLVCPVKNSIWLLIKKQDGSFEEKEHQGFVFVPLIKDEKTN